MSAHLAQLQPSLVRLANVASSAAPPTSQDRKKSGLGTHVRSLGRKIYDQLKQAALAEVKPPSEYEVPYSRFSSRASRKQKLLAHYSAIAENLFQPLTVNLKPEISPVLQRAVLERPSNISSENPAAPEALAENTVESTVLAPNEVDDNAHSKISPPLDSTPAAAPIAIENSIALENTDASMPDTLPGSGSNDKDLNSVQAKSTDETAVHSTSTAACTNNNTNTSSHPDQSSESLEESDDDEEPDNIALKEWKRRRREWTKGKDHTTSAADFEEWRKTGPLKGIPEAAYSGIYNRMVKECRTLKEPMNLADAVRVIKAGWVADGTWPKHV